MVINTYPDIFYKTAIQIYEAYFFADQKDFTLNIFNIDNNEEIQQKLFIFLDLLNDMQNDLSIKIILNVSEGRYGS